MNLKKNIYLLHEVSNREIETKLFLSFVANKFGYRCYLLQRNFFLENIKKFYPGIVIYKSLTGSDLSTIKIIKNNDHKIVCIDEEGILQWEEEFKYKLRINNETLTYCDKLFVMNSKHKNRILKYYKSKNLFKKVIALGYPRLEYLNYFSKNLKSKNKICNEIKKKYGNYIFFTSSMMTNNLMGKENWRMSFVDNWLSKKIDKNKLTFSNNVWRLYNFQLNKQLELLEFLSSNLKKINFIMRPHPTENVELWKKRFQNDNVYFDDHIYPSHYFVLPALCTIQYGSTIAYESYAMEKVSTEFSCKEGKKLKKLELKDHKKIIFEFNDKEKLLKHINHMISSQKKERKFFLKKEKMFKILKENLGSSERIINDFENFRDIQKTKIVKFDISFYLSKIFFKRFILWIYAFFRIYKIVPKSLIRGKFIILGEKYAMNHLKHYQYKKKKQAYVPNEIIYFVKNLCNKKMKKNFNLFRIHKNNFLID